MNEIDLRKFGIECTCPIHGTVAESWCGESGLIFLFGENHRDREMKRLNVLNARNLFDCKAVECIGTEIQLRDFGALTKADIEIRSNELFEAHKTDDAVVSYLDQKEPWWYGPFEFASTVKLLRPSLVIRCVEDLKLKEEMQPIWHAYQMHVGGPHPFPQYPKFSDHPYNLKREHAMIENSLSFWKEFGQERAMILNTGSDHCQPIANGLRERGISYIQILISPIA
jgi:hypothetical protein